MRSIADMQTPKEGNMFEQQAFRDNGVGLDTH